MLITFTEIIAIQLKILFLSKIFNININGKKNSRWFRFSGLNCKIMFETYEMETFHNRCKHDIYFEHIVTNFICKNIVISSMDLLIFNLGGNEVVLYLKFWCNCISIKSTRYRRLNALDESVNNELKPFYIGVFSPHNSRVNVDLLLWSRTITHIHIHKNS